MVIETVAVGDWLLEIWSYERSEQTFILELYLTQQMIAMRIRQFLQDRQSAVR